MGRHALERAAQAAPARPREGQGDPELFAAFFEQVTGEALTDEQAQAFAGESVATALLGANIVLAVLQAIIDNLIPTDLVGR